MKQIMAIAFTFGLILMWNPTTSAQSKYRMNIGIGVSTAMNGSYQFTMEHHFARKWSMIASAGLRFNSSHASEETIRHRSEFDAMPVLDTLSTPRHKESFGFSYWPQGTDKGIALSIGAEYISRDGFDAICGIAYRIPIWKGLSADLSYKVRCIGPVLYRKKDTGSAEVNLYYSF